MRRSTRRLLPRTCAKKSPDRATSLAVVVPRSLRPSDLKSDKRLPSLPDVPTMAELGLPQVTVSNWLGLVAPKGTPPAVIRKLNEAFNKALASADLREKIAGPGNVVGGGSPEEFAAF